MGTNENQVDPKISGAFLKGEVRRFFLLAQSFYWPQTKTSFYRQISPKIHEVGQKLGQRAQNSQNKDQMAPNLLWESTNFRIGFPQ